MFERYIQRENTIFEILQSFLDEGLDFVLIGGYAVSAFKHRFSVDADIIIKEEDLKKFEDVLKNNGFTRTKSKDLENLYSTKYARFEKDKELTVSVDLLIGGMGIRQTNSALSFDMINKNSSQKMITGLEKEIKVKIPSKELLIAIKLQAGRLTDFRDVAALCKNIDTVKIKNFLKNTDKKILKKHVDYMLSIVDKKEFLDSFKGVFMEKKFDIEIETIKKLKEII